MKSRFCSHAKRIAIVLAVPILSAAVGFALYSCGGSGGGASGTGKVVFANFQAAAIVIGQPDFESYGTGSDSNMLDTPYGNVGIGSLYVPDYYNNRVLGFDAIPTIDGADADFVLGQTDFGFSVAGDAADEMNGPVTAQVDGGKLFVAEYDNNRVLIWNTPPTSSTVSADLVVGQAGFPASLSGCTDSNLDAPEDMFVVGGKLIVGDSNNNRVMIWNSIPTSDGVAAALVLGQPNFDTCSPGTSATEMDYPAGVWSDGTRLVVADADNNRVLIWTTFPTTNGQAADLVLGQANMGTAFCAVSARNLCFPYFVTSNGKQLFVVDADNNRVLIWNSFPTADYTPANKVLGQSNFLNYDCNDVDQDGTGDITPSAKTLCFPSGVRMDGKNLFVTDSDNSRILIFKGL